MIDSKVGIIGGGNMARAIAAGLLRGGMHAADLLIAEPRVTQCELLREELYGAQVTRDNATVARVADILLFAVKPQILQGVCRDLAGEVQKRKMLIVSIAAGSRTADIADWLGGNLEVVRVMPNQPALIDQGISALYANDQTGQNGREQAGKIMSAVGQVVWVRRETEMDAVTAVSGTGPAYFYLLIEIMIESAEALGLDPGIARTLVLQTARGATSLAAATDESMASLIERVRSPGGTTKAAFDVLEPGGVRAIFAEAIDAAHKRSVELSLEAKSAVAD